MKCAILTLLWRQYPLWLILAMLTASAIATIFVVADPSGASVTLRNEAKITVIWTKITPLAADPNYIDVVTRGRVQ